MTEELSRIPPPALILRFKFQKALKLRDFRKRGKEKPFF
jgi:hypothetical protein